MIHAFGRGRSAGLLVQEVEVTDNGFRFLALNGRSRPGKFVSSKSVIIFDRKPNEENKTTLLWSGDLPQEYWTDHLAAVEWVDSQLLKKKAKST